VSVVARYLEAVSSLDWETAEGCLAEDVLRVGPFGDTYRGKAAYLEFLRNLMPTLQGYRMDLGPVIEANAGATAVAELTETVTLDGKTVVTPECLVFQLDSAGRIVEIRIYIQQP
jgi:ketosteroid isomerase-like protein